jgi:hypothetical protein
VSSTAADFPNCLLAGQALKHQFGAVEEGGEEGGPAAGLDEQGHPGGGHVCDGHLLDAAVHHGESSHGSIAARSKYNIPSRKEKSHRKIIRHYQLKYNNVNNIKFGRRIDPHSFRLGGSKISISDSDTVHETE